MENEKEVMHDRARISGRTEGPFGTDDADADRVDNKHTAEQENSANGLDSRQVRGGQDGRNERAIGSTDLDSENGVLRLGDMDNSSMEVTDEGANAAVAEQAKTNTAMVDVTTSGPDDYASNDQVRVPNAQEAAKQQDTDEEDNTDDSTEDRDDDVAETGTDLNNQPEY